MARLPRNNSPSIEQHIVQRGNHHQVSFFAEADYAVYPDKLKLYAKHYYVAVHAYELMTHHVHLLVTQARRKRQRHKPINAVFGDVTMCVISNIPARQ
jgi:putative transposase